MRPSLASTLLALSLPGAAYAQCELASLAPADPLVLEQFGDAIAFDGDLLAVRSEHGYAGPGHVRVFRRAAAGWELEQELEAPPGAGVYGFGADLALEGERLVVGFFGAELAGGVDGAAYVYERDSSSGAPVWALVQVLGNPDNSPVSTLFGHELELCGDWLAISNRYALSSNGQQEGVVRMYRYDPIKAEFAPAGQLELPAFGQGTWFGDALALTQNYAVVGNPGHHAAHLKEGRAYVYVRDGLTWSYEKTLTPVAPQEDLRFGSSLAAFEDGEHLRVAVAAPSTSAHHDEQIVQVYERQLPVLWFTPEYVLEDELILGDSFGQDFGRSLDLSADRLCVGAPTDDAAGSDSGSVTTYRRNAQSHEWELEFQLLPALPQGDDRFGSALARSGDELAIGAPGENTTGPEAGSVDLYALEPLLCPEVCDAPQLAQAAAELGAQFGHSVDIEGDWMLVGAPGANVQGNDSGAATLFRRYEHCWARFDELQPFQLDGFDRFGSAVALNGKHALVGAPEAGNFPYRGQATLYERRPFGWVRVKTFFGNSWDEHTNFGKALDLGEETIAFGFGDDDGPSGVAAARAGLYPNDWLADDNLPLSVDALGARAGEAVRVDGTWIAVGAPGQSVNGHDEAGSVHLVRHDGDAFTGVWVEEHVFEVPLAQGGEEFGAALAFDGGRLVVGAPGEDGRGKVYVYEEGFHPLVGFGWAVVKVLTPPSNALGQRFGASLDFEGELLVVGAPGEGEELAGASYLYSKESGAWQLHQSYPLAGGHLGDRMGQAVALSGGWLASGAEAAAGTGQAFAHEYVALPKDFVGDTHALSLATGGAQQLSLLAGPEHAGRLYWILGSASTGFSGSGGGSLLGTFLPLVQDWYFDLQLFQPGVGALDPPLGILNAQGEASSTFSLPPGLPANFVGTQLSHLYIVMDGGQIVGVSDKVHLKLVD